MATSSSLAGDKTVLTEKDPTVVQYWHISCHGNLTVPCYDCSKCEKTFSPTAAQVHSMQSTPVVATVWISLDMLDLYDHLGLDEGLSCTGKFA